MDDDEIFARCADRRRAVADLVDTLDEEALARQSLCADWDVRTVVGHLIVPLVVPPARFGLTVLRHRGDFHRAGTTMARDAARASPYRLAAILRERAERRFTPPLHGPAAPLTDLAVHTCDIRVPLGLPIDIRLDEAETAFDLLGGFSMFFVPRGRLRGIRLVPDDLDRTWGQGAELRGPAADILLAVLGRDGFVDRVSGPGRDLLAARP